MLHILPGKIVDIPRLSYMKTYLKTIITYIQDCPIPIEGVLNVAEKCVHI